MQSVFIGKRGWLRLEGPDGLAVDAQIGERGGRRVITTLIFRSGSVTAATLRNAPIGWLEAVINTPDLAAKMDSLNEGDTLSVHHDVSASDSIGLTDSATARVTPAGVRAGESPAIVTGEASVVGVGVATGTGTAFPATVQARAYIPDATVPKLSRPDGSNPEAFYKLVAQAYNAAVARTDKPAKMLAEQADVPVPTVHRWIAEARRRGLLPPARRGKAG